MATELIAPKTGAEVSKFIQVGDRETANLIAFGFVAGAEEIEVLQSPDGGSTSEPAVEDGVPVVLSLTNKTVSVKGPARIAVDKPDTGSQVVGVSAFVAGSI